MNSNDAFRCGSPCYALPLATTATGAFQFDVANAGDITLWLYNPGPNSVFFAYGNDGADALANAVIPTSGNAQKGIFLGPGSIQTFTFSAKQRFAGIAMTGAQTIYVIAGSGL